MRNGKQTAKHVRRRRWVSLANPPTGIYVPNRAPGNGVSAPMRGTKQTGADVASLTEDATVTTAVINREGKRDKL